LTKTIAIIINTTWNIYNFRKGLIQALQKEGYKVIAISPKDEYAKKLEEIGCKHFHIDIDNKGTNPIKDMKLILDYYKLFKKHNIDLVLGYTIKPNIYGSFASGLANIPIITNISGLGTVFLNNNFSSKIAKLLYKIALKIPKKVFFQNRDDLELFVKLNLVNKNKARVIPGSGIDTNKFFPATINKKDGKTKFLLIARLIRDKGVFEYIEAAKIIKEKYPNTEFAILGSFYLQNPTALTKEELKKWENEGIIKYLGVSDNIKDIIAQYDCIVLPSYREGLSRVLLEAASMAKPIITTNVPGCRDVVEDGVNGFLCEVKNSKSLSNAIEKFLTLSNEEREIMGQKGREKVIKEFDEKVVIDIYLEEIKNILNL